MTYCPTPRPTCSSTRSGAANFTPISSSDTCGGASTSTCKARHNATRTAVLSGATICCLSSTTFYLLDPGQAQFTLRSTWPAAPNDDTRVLTKRIGPQNRFDTGEQPLCVRTVHEQCRFGRTALVAVVLAEAVSLDGLLKPVGQGHNIALFIDIVWQARGVEVHQDALLVVRLLGWFGLSAKQAGEKSQFVLPRSNDSALSGRRCRGLVVAARSCQLAQAAC